MEARRRDGGADPRSASCRAQKTYNWLQMRMSSSVTLYGRNRTGVAMLPNDCRRQSVGNAALRRLLTSPSVCQFFVTSFSLRSIDVAREVPSAIAIAATVSTGKKTQWKRRGRVKKKRSRQKTQTPSTRAWREEWYPGESSAAISLSVSEGWPSSTSQEVGPSRFDRPEAAAAATEPALAAAVVVVAADGAPPVQPEVGLVGGVVATTLSSSLVNDASILYCSGVVMVGQETLDLGQ